MGKQKYTDARKTANQKWDAKNLDRINIAIPAGSKAQIKSYAESKGYKSINRFIISLIESETGLTLHKVDD